MFDRRNVTFLVLVALALAVPVVGSAQTSRVEGMAIQGDYIKDYTGIYTYTSQVSNVGNLVYAELGVSDGATFLVDRSVGVVAGNWWEGRYGTWAFHLREFTPQLGQGDLTSSPSPGTLGFDPNFNANESFDIMWGKKFGTTSLGLRLNRSFFKLEGDDILGLGFSKLEYDYPSTGSTNPAAANFTRNIFGVGAGVGFEMSPTTNVELNLLWQGRTYQISDTLGATAEEDGPTTYQVAARAFWQWQPNVVVTPVFKWSSYDLSTKSPAGTTSDNTLKSWQLGLAGNWTLGSNDLLVMGLTFAQNKADQATPVIGVTGPGTTGFFAPVGTITETFSPQIFSALETHVNNWLTLRFGANKGVWHRIEVEDTATPLNTKWSDSPFSMAIGAGVKVGTLQLDAILNDVLPHNGLYLFSGSPTSPLASKVTATYSY